MKPKTRKLLKSMSDALFSFALNLEKKSIQELFDGVSPVPWRYILQKDTYYAGKKEGYIEGHKAAAAYIKRIAG